MNRSRYFVPILALLFMVMPLSMAQAQGPVDLAWLRIKFWPEYDDPRLLVIIDGQVAQPDSTVRLPIPDDAELNAVASANEQGRLLTNDWTMEKGEKGERILVFTPQFPAFRVEYYEPLAMNGDQRVIDFELPAGFITTREGSIEVLLPPGSQDVELDPPAEDAGPTQDKAHLFERSLGEVTAEDAIRQKIVYANPSGGLTVPETGAAPTQPQAPAEPASPPSTPSKSSQGLPVSPWILLLGVAALLLIIGGVVGLWMTREQEDEEPLPAPAAAPKRRSKSKTTVQPANMDRYCRHCGREFGPEDRYCRYCGTKRQTIQ